MPVDVFVFASFIKVPLHDLKDVKRHLVSMKHIRRGQLKRLC